MSGALAEALVAAQRRAIAAVEKAVVADTLAETDATETLNAIGCTDAVDQRQLFAALATIRALGASAPAEPRPNGDAPAEPAKATDAQVKFAQSLFERAQVPALAESDLRSLPRERMSTLLESLKAGTYDASVWDVPF